jgi:hypothetical protein
MKAQSLIKKQIEYPALIECEADLNYLIRRCCQQAAKEAVRQVLMQTGQIKPVMTAAECYRQAGSRWLVDSAIRKGKLKCVKKGGSVLVQRDEFENWMGRHDFLI